MYDYQNLCVSGSFTEIVHREASKDLGFSELIPFTR